MNQQTCIRRRAKGQFLIAATGLLLLLSGNARAQQVRLSLDHYHALLDQTRMEAPTSIEPAAPYAVESAVLHVRVGERTASVTTKLRAWLFADGWHGIALNTSGQVLSVDFGASAESAAAERRLDTTGQMLWIRGTGRHDVTIEEAIDLSSQEGATRRRRELTLELPAAASVSGTLQTATGDEVEVVGGGSLVPVPGDDLQFVGQPGGSFRLIVTGAAPVSDRSDRALRFSSLVVSDLHLHRTRSVVEVQVVANVLQGSLDELELELPAGYTVQEVDDSLLAGWDVVDGRLRARLLSPASTRAVLRLRLDGPVAVGDSSLQAPVVIVVGDIRSRQLVRATVHGEGILSVGDSGSAFELDRLPDGAAPPVRAAGSLEESRSSAVYQLGDATQPPTWHVVWPQQSEVLALRVDGLVVDALVGADGQALVSWQLAVANRGSQSLEVQFPNGFQLVRAERGGVRMRPGVTASGGLALPLDGGAQRHHFSIVGLVPVTAIGGVDGRGELVLDMPALNAPVSEVFVRAQLPNGWRYRLREDARATSDLRARSLGTDRSLLAVPPGFVALHAVWSAMSPRPGSVTIDILEKRTREEWF